MKLRKSPGLNRADLWIVERRQRFARAEKHVFVGWGSRQPVSVAEACPDDEADVRGVRPRMGGQRGIRRQRSSPRLRGAEPLLRPGRLIQEPKLAWEKPGCPSFGAVRRTGRFPRSAVASQDRIRIYGRRAQRRQSLRHLLLDERQIRRYALSRIQRPSRRASLIKHVIDAKAIKARRCIAFPLHVEVHCKALAILISLQCHAMLCIDSLIHPAGVWVDARLSFAFCAYRPTLNAYCGRTQSVRVSPSSSQTVGRALRPAETSAASGSPPNLSRQTAPGRLTFTARLR